MLAFEHFQCGKKCFLKNDTAVFYIDPEKKIHVLSKEGREINSLDDLIASESENYILVSSQHFLKEEHGSDDLSNDFEFIDSICKDLGVHKKVYIHIDFIYAMMRIEYYSKDLFSYINEIKKRKLGFINRENNFLFNGPVILNENPENQFFQVVKKIKPWKLKQSIREGVFHALVKQGRKIGEFLDEDMIVDSDRKPLLDVENNYGHYKITEALHFLYKVDEIKHVDWRGVQKFHFENYKGDVSISDNAFGFDLNVILDLKLADLVIENQNKFPHLRSVAIKNIKGKATIGSCAFWVMMTKPEQRFFDKVEILDLEAVREIGLSAFGSSTVMQEGVKQESEFFSFSPIISNYSNIFSEEPIPNHTWSNVRTISLGNIQKIGITVFASASSSTNYSWSNVTELNLLSLKTIKQNVFSSSSALCSNYAWSSVKKISVPNLNSLSFEQFGSSAGQDNFSWSNVEELEFESCVKLDRNVFLSVSSKGENHAWSNVCGIQIPYLQKIGKRAFLSGSLKSNYAWSKIKQIDFSGVVSIGKLCFNSQSYESNYAWSQVERCDMSKTQTIPMQCFFSFAFRENKAWESIKKLDISSATDIQYRAFYSKGKVNTAWSGLKHDESISLEV